MGATGANDGDLQQKLFHTFTDGNLGHQSFDSSFGELVFSTKGYHCTLVVSVLIICMCAAFLCSTSRLPLCDTHSLSSEGDAGSFE